MSRKWILRASEIDTFLTCPRKWGFCYLENVAAPSSPAAQFGTSVHSFLEKCLKGIPINFDTPEGRVIIPGLQFLPRHVPHENVEKKIFFESGHHTFFGTPDFFEHIDNQTWSLGDHKTCSSFTTALTPQQLKKNVQANIYAQWLIREKNAQTIKLKWIYYRTKSCPDARLIETTISKDEANVNFNEILKIADEMLSLTSLNPTKLKKQRTSCFKYGRCPYYALCGNEKSFKDQSKNMIKEFRNKQTQTDSFHLYVDCAPVKSEKCYERTIELSDLLKPVLEKIKEEKELSHYRLAGYGQHVGLIANYLGEHLKNNAYDSHTAVLSSSKTPEGCDTLQTLSAAAGRVVRGF